MEASQPGQSGSVKNHHRQTRSEELLNVNVNKPQGWSAKKMNLLLEPNVDAQGTHLQHASYLCINRDNLVKFRQELGTQIQKKLKRGNTRRLGDRVGAGLRVHWRGILPPYKLWFDYEI
ncbi:unnamed protein product [Cuscuta campestris]|uniref:Uncharacterized protein n=1 Tax=Cuscuta campestris TaxID=132261 RepID=A0A484KG34_9ASTE|nr:unnamed protein product [Cuscuta campestris]